MDLPAARRYALGRLTHDLPRNLFYHNMEHTLLVTEAARRIGLLEGLPEKELMLLETAALYHDLGFIRRYSDNETISCDFAKESLPGCGFQPDEIEAVCRMIMATQIPQSPQNLSEMVLCDADLDYLGTDGFAVGSSALRKELAGQGRLFSEREWMLFVLRFLKGHHYFTATAVRTRDDSKRAHMAAWQEQLLSMPTDEV